ncbi:MAG: efflux RND transporter periplasmic adaptor subunit [Planctomycetaceae bacterium]
MLKRWIKRFLGLLLLGGLAGGLVYSFLPKPVPVDLSTVTRGPLQVTVDEDGRTRIRDRYIVSAPLAGKLGRIRMKPGAHVQPGDLLTTIEPSDPALLDPRAVAQAEARVKGARSAVERANSSLEAAKVSLDHAESEYARAVELYRKKAISPTDYELKVMLQRTQTEEYRVARHSKEISEFELEQAEAALLRTRPNSASDMPDGEFLFSLRAPPVTVPGGTFQVLRVMQESEAVVTPGQNLLELGDPSDLEVEVDVLSADAVKIVPGARVSLEQWGGDQPLEGRVRLVEPSGFLKISALGVEEQRVNVIVDFPDRTLVPKTLGDQFRVEARISVWEGADVLQVPMSALFRRGDSWAMFRVIEGRAVETPIKIGHQNGRFAEVLEGLSEADTVIIHPGDQVSDGKLVQPRV